MQELENQMKRHIYVKQDLIEGGIQVANGRSIEADDEMAMKIR